MTAPGGVTDSAMEKVILRKGGKKEEALSEAPLWKLGVGRRENFFFFFAFLGLPLWHILNTLNEARD